MLNTIRETIANAARSMQLSEEERRKILAERYPDSPMALRIQWLPVNTGGSNICTHKLVRVSPLQMVFRPTIQVRLISAIFVLVGLGIMILPLMAQEAPWWIAIIGLVFAGAGGLIYHHMTRPSVFDMEKLWFWKGRMPESAEEVESRDNTAPLDRVVALQVVRQYCQGSHSTRNRRHTGGRLASHGTMHQGYYSYELNLVLDDTTRINVINHGNHRAILRDARQLAEFLGVPFWDGSDL